MLHRPVTVPCKLGWRQEGIGGFAPARGGWVDSSEFLGKRDVVWFEDDGLASRASKEILSFCGQMRALKMSG